MAHFGLLLRCIGEAVCANGLKALAGLVPLGAVVYDVAENACQRLRESEQEGQIARLVESAAAAGPAEVKAEAAVVAAEVAGGESPEVQGKLAEYLAQVPALLRRSLRRPGDPSGKTAPPGFRLRRTEDLIALLPLRFARFQPGDRPVGIGDWELDELLGEGGFGEVWKARHIFFDGIAPVALKFCLDPFARDRLLRHEANVLNQVMRQGRHPGIVPLLDASLSADPPCLRYEFVEGGDLAALAREWPVSVGERWKQASVCLGRLARIVAFAHRLQPPVVHRDLKPANVLVHRGLDGEAVLRVTDFGIGGVAALQALRGTREGSTGQGEALATSLRGAHTPLYAGPQQARGDAPDPRDDVYALGVVWYQILSGEMTAGAPTGLWADELEESGVPRGVVRLLGSCVSAKAERRPATAEALAEQLEVLLTPAPVVLPAAPLPVGRPTWNERLERFLNNGQTGALSWLLDLNNKRIGDAGLTALAQSPRLSQLSVLILSGCDIGDAGIEALAASPHACNLTRLSLWDNRVGDHGLAALAGSPHLENLTSLDIGRNRIGDAGIVALAASPYVARLSALMLVSNHVGDEGAVALAQSAYLGSLAELKPLDNRITSVGVSALKAKFGNRVRVM